MYYLIPLLLLFLAGLYFYVFSNSRNTREGMSSNDNLMSNNGQTRCPNILVQKGKNFYLYNSKIAKIPGVNPIQFNNLEEYTDFMNWQRSQGIRCPVLFLQHNYDIQGNPGYNVRPSPHNLQGGLPHSLPHANPNPTLLMDATRNDQPYNINSVPSYDKSSQYVGATTPLDTMNQEDENLLFSADAMKDNWAGPDYTQSLVDNGYYKGNEVSLYVG
jgi:hypothetical protein